ncbi:hypothetical protein COT98_02115 [Candidatus Falkowbacteria bacterium CG10_big_fil_rev_8_21_14_0_10_39_9]|uniref:Fibrobacter succinogenes major paralogous domain-containing protein n=1 Tax=Candidatus Falkowbacteria bacterium CG10_big_fil_rev_8_21_14_0_10_39_9 TaxID=1974566 RepID=A0A2M6WPQ4_9BACT|nr:MAG: hypothetical protein COT98_02115 [Candidatus Falkowbacteria bacterium CG10_big_fil_rev_8_21_14_0_10_39_9]
MQYSAAELAQGICPEGWHIPTDGEQNTLDQNLNDTTCDANRGDRGCANAGTKLKVGGTSHFEGVLAGQRSPDNLFDYHGINALFWSSTINNDSAFSRSLRSSYATVERHDYPQDLGFSVRCLQD